MEFHRIREANVGWSRVFEAHQTIQKVGQVGQVPIFIGIFAGWNLANLTNLARSRDEFGRARFQPSGLLFS